MRYNKLLLLVPLALMASCDNNAESYISSADSVIMSEDLTAINSPSRKIIHTADIRCRVNNVYKAVDTLEKMVNTLGGLVADSRMENDIDATQSVRYKTDSQKHVRSYTTTARLTLRVPAIYLDTVIRQVPMLASFIDNRTRQRHDVTLQYLSNAMKNEAAGVAPPVVADKKKGGIRDNPRQTHINAAKADTVTDRRIANLQILDDVNYATLQVELYQPEMVDVQVVADVNHAAVVPFGTRLQIAAYDGWQFSKGLLIVFVTAWPVWLLALVVWYIIIILRRKKLLFFASK